MRRYVIAGLLVWVPILVTVLVVRFILDLMDQTQAEVFARDPLRYGALGPGATGTTAYTFFADGD